MYQIIKSHLLWKSPTPEFISCPETERGKIQIYVLLHEDPAYENHHSMHVYDDPATGRSSVFQKEKKKHTLSLFVFCFVFWIDHFPLKIHILMFIKIKIMYIYNLRNDFSDFGENRLSLQKSPW